MKIILQDGSVDTAWNDYVSSHPQGTPFHLTAWRDAIVRAFGHEALYFAAVENGTIRGILPLTHIKSRLFGNVLSSVAFAAYGGILADNNEVFTRLLEIARKAAALYRVDYLEMKFLDEPPCDLPRSDLHVTFVKELSTNHEENFQAVPRKQRRMIRVGIKSGLKAEVGNHLLDDFYRVFAVNVRRMGTPVYSRKWFAALLESFGDNAEIMTVEHEGRVISGVLSLYFRDTVYPYYAASLVEHRKYAPNDFQYWELMKRAVDRGCRRFDYGRSKKNTGQFDYKRHWGFTPRPLHYSYILNRLSEVPAVNPMNPRYKRKIEAWKKLPLSLTKIIGPHIVKSIP